MTTFLAISGPFAAALFAGLWFFERRARKNEREAMFASWDAAVRRATGEIRTLNHMLDVA